VKKKTTKKPPKAESSVFIAHVSADLKRRFKAHCDRRGVSMSRDLTEYMKGVVEANAEDGEPSEEAE
jgi:hypothetical protein